jgi:hypothetical protein
MTNEPSCALCRWYRLLREGAVIGRCCNPLSGTAFPRQSFWCRQFEADTHNALREMRPLLPTSSQQR